MTTLCLILLTLTAYFALKAHGLRTIDAEEIPVAIDAESEEL